MCDQTRELWLQKEVKRERGKRNHTLPQPEMEGEGVVTKYIYLQHSVIICIMKEINQN